MARTTIYLDNSEDEEEELNDCLLCEKGIFANKFPSVIAKALEWKYC